ncbi:hypothetical protein HK098_003904 [Nowakowskiella sp. JEL0407]|nr:hypothetical protein HK098_003904 [Nowakowskiella sp. JEL0407]
MSASSSTAVDLDATLQSINVADESTPLIPKPSYSDTSSDSSNDTANTDANTPKIKSLPLILTAIFMGIFLSALDQTIVAAIFSAIGSEFHASTQISWIATSYLLTTTAFQPVYGSLSTIFGQRNTLLLALFVFTVGSAGCGLSFGSIWTIVSWRAVAGVGGGGILTMSTIIMSDLVSLKERGQLQGVANAVYGTAALVGGPLGGILTDWVSWRYAFLINVPVGVGVMIIVLWLLPENLGPSATITSANETIVQKLSKLDFLGIVILTTATTLLTLSISLAGNELPFTHPIVISLFVVSILLFIVFYHVEEHVKYPVIPMRVIRDGFYCYMLTFWANMANFGMVFLVPLFFVAVKSETATSAGIHLIPKIVSISFGSLLAGIYMTYSGEYWRVTIFSLIMMLLADSYVTFYWTFTTTEIEFFTSLISDGLGFGVTLTTGLVAMLAVLKQADTATGSALLYTFRSIGSILGVAISQMLFQYTLKESLVEKVVGENSEFIIDLVRRDMSAIPSIPSEFIMPVKESYLIAFRYGMSVVIVCVVFAIISTTKVKVVKLENTEETSKEDLGVMMG